MESYGTYGNILPLSSPKQVAAGVMELEGVAPETTLEDAGVAVVPNDERGAKVDDWLLAL